MRKVSFAAAEFLCVQSSGKLEMERGMVKPMIRGEQQDSRSDPLHPLPPSALSSQRRPPFSWC